MPAAARMGGTDTVACTDGAQGSLCGINPSRYHWDTPTTQSTDEGSFTVFVNGIGVVRKGDKMISHPDGDPCTVSPIFHAPTLSSYSSSVFADGKNIGRIGDVYNSDGHFSHTISSGSPNVFIGSEAAVETEIIYIEANGYLLVSEDDIFIIG